jgi:hypothetical protein
MHGVRKLLASAAAVVGMSAVPLIGHASPASAQIYPGSEQAAEILVGVPCTATDTTLDCAGFNENNIYVSTHYDDTTGDSTAYVFNPYDGRSTHVNVYVENGTVTIHYIDSERGVIIIAPLGWGDLASPDGWLSVFYPSGNPFSAAVQSVTEGLGLPWQPDTGDGGLGGGSGGRRPSPIQP